MRTTGSTRSLRYSGVILDPPSPAAAAPLRWCLTCSVDFTSASQAVSRYLLGYEFNATVLVLTRHELHVLTSEKKAKFLEPLKVVKGIVKIVLHT